MKKNPGIAAVLSFFIPGAGFIYCERYLTGIIVTIWWFYLLYELIFRNAIWCLLWGGLTWTIAIWRSAKSASVINNIIDELNSKST